MPRFILVNLGCFATGAAERFQIFELRDDGAYRSSQSGRNWPMGKVAVEARLVRWKRGDFSDEGQPGRAAVRRPRADTPTP